jgi:hypothetical protein
MGEIEGLRRRVEAVRRGYAELSRDGWGDPGPLDEHTGERWDRGNVLGHVAEMVPFWTGQVRAVLAGADSMGRDEVGNAQRRMGIDAGREAGEEGLLDRVDAGVAGLLALLDDLSDADLDRELVHHAGSEERRMRLGDEVEAVLVSHLEGHLDQLRELGG